MVSYFYKASYNVSQYDTCKSLLHAQVAIIADKYDCVSLYKLAKISFADTVNAVESDDWVAVAALIYDHTTTELPAHEELRGLAVAAVANRPAVLRVILQLENTTGLLRSTVDLASDLLLSGPYMSKKEDVSKKIFTCGRCQYHHVGSHDCTYLAVRNGFLRDMTCPQCGSQTGLTSKRQAYRVGPVESISCPSCDGFHTVEPVAEPQPSTLNAGD